jgi:hypothetical protein
MTCKIDIELHSIHILSVNPEEEEIFRKYAWDYFEYHADQRMKTFNFFIVMAGLLAGGITSLLKDGGSPWWITPLGILLFILSIVFWKLDQRNRMLVRNGEAAIRYLDSLHQLPNDEGGVPHILKIFERDDYICQRIPIFPLTKARLSYTKSLAIVFALFAFFGIFFAVGCFFIPAKAPAEPRLKMHPPPPCDCRAGIVSNHQEVRVQNGSAIDSG